MKGIATIELRTAEYIDGQWVAGDVIESLEKDNQIVYSRYNEYLSESTYGTRQVGDNTLSRLWICEFWAEGPGSTAGLTETYGALLEETFTAKTPTTAAYWTFKRRWDPPADNTVRSIKSIGLETLSIVSLGTEFIQNGRNVSLGIQPQILDVTYRLYVSDGTTDFTCYPYAASKLASAFNYGSDTNASNNTGYPSGLMFHPWSTDDLEDDRLCQASHVQNNRTSTKTVNGTRRVIDAVTYMQANWSSLTADVGQLISTAFVGISTFATTKPVSVFRPNMSAIQNTFGRSPGNNKAYLDVDHLATGSGTVTIDDLAGWQRDCDLAKKYRILITASGNQTAATYKVLKREWTGTGGDNIRDPLAFNLYKSAPLRNITTGDYYASVDGKTYYAHGLKWNAYAGWPTSHNDVYSQDFYIQPYIYPEYIAANSSGITICHLSKPWQNVDVNSTIPLPVGGVCQIQHTADGTIYVACAVTGLWKIERTLGAPVGSVTAITRITASNAEDDTKCRGFQIKKSDGSWWAIFGREMCKSTDNGATWTVYNNSTTPQFSITNVTNSVDNAVRIVSCTIDPNHADNRFVICLSSSYTDSDGGGKFVWWSVGGSAAASDELAGDLDMPGLSARLLSTRAVYCTQSGRWIMWHPSGSAYCYIYTGFKGTVYSFLSNSVSYGNHGGPCGGLGVNIFIAEDGTEYLMGYANSSTLVTTANPGGTNFATHHVAYPINTLDLTVGQSNAGGAADRGIGNKWTQYLGYPLPSFVVDQYNSYSTDDTYIYIGNGVIVSAYQNVYNVYGPISTGGLAHHIPGSDLDQGVTLGFWKQYGWDGSAWVEGNPNSRTVHTSRQALIDGLHITFGTGTYVDNEWYDTYVYKGVLKDNATTFTFSTEVFKTATFETSNLSLNGSIFTTVPASNVGTVVAEPMTAMVPTMYYSSNNNTVEDSGTYHWLEPGVVAPNTAYSRYTITPFSEKLEGDYEISFRVCQVYLSGAAFFVKPYSNDFTASSIYSGSRTFKEYILIDRTAAGNDKIRRLRVVNFGGSTIFTSADFNNASISDVYAIKRVSGVVSYWRNGTLLYTSLVTDTSDHQFVFGTLAGSGPFSVIKDLKVNYTINRRYLDIGNGVNTGRADPNFRKMVLHDTVRAKVNSVSIDGVPATINWDSYTPPGPGQVTIMEYSGRVWFNEADAGKSVTGTFTYLKKLNRSGVAPELDTNIYVDVTVANGENFYGAGPKFFLDGVEAPHLTLIPGQTYVFRVNDTSCTGYNFRFSLTPDGDHRYRGVELLSRTVSGTPGTTEAYVSIVAPDSLTKLYYYDFAIQGMGNEPDTGWIMPVDDAIVVTVSNPGAGNKYFLDGVETPTLNLKQGGRYKFDQSEASNAGHPLRFSLTDGGTHNSGTQIKTGTYSVGTPGTAGAYTIIEVFEGHDNVYYYCSAHSGMGGAISTNTDRHWDKVTLLTHLDGTSGSTDITAATTVVSPFTSVTLSGNAQLNDTQSKFGGASIILDGTDDDVFVSTSAASVFTDQYTFELWFRSTVQMSTVDDVLFVNNTHTSGGYNYFQPGSVGTSGVNLGKGVLNYGGTIYYTKRTVDVLFPINTWVHVALVRDSRYNVRLYINGVLEIDVGNSAWGANLKDIRIGRYYNGNNDCTGFVDEIRYTRNVARYYGSSFPVQIAQFPNS